LSDLPPEETVVPDFFTPVSDAQISLKMPAWVETGIKEPAIRRSDIKETADRAVLKYICPPTGRCAGSAGESHFFLTISLFLAMAERSYRNLGFIPHFSAR
jgi:hypothetical protein